MAEDTKLIHIYTCIHGSNHKIRTQWLRPDVQGHALAVAHIVAAQICTAIFLPHCMPLHVFFVAGHIVPLWANYVCTVPFSSWRAGAARAQME